MSVTITPELRARIESYEAWYHEFDFGGGVVSRPKHPHRDIWQATDKFLEPVNFTGKSVLDIGCWDGYWSFLAERRGASSVFATDDNSQHWTRLADGWGASNSPAPGQGFQLAYEALGSRVRYRGDVNVYHLDRLGEQFDIILCLGVFYHLTHLMSALTQLRHAVKPGGCVILEGAAIKDERKSAMDFLLGPDDGYNGLGSEPERADASNWSVPTIRCLKDMLTACYFETTRAWFPFDHLLRGRVFVEARPVVFNNPNYDYRPAFGLDRYDTRFGDVR
jgi:tRNA (mo5U34)-methyltransferase